MNSLCQLAAMLATKKWAYDKVLMAMKSTINSKGVSYVEPTLSADEKSRIGRFLCSLAEFA
jgi:hypothetical protein